MSSFNNIEKIKYENNTPDPVTMSEYIIFSDERNEEKYLVFKFKNNLNQSLCAIKAEITAYDSAKNVLEKLTLSYGGFSAYDNDDFVPNAKLKVNFNCKSISYKLLYAKFERTIWENGAFEVIPYTAEDFTNDFSKKNGEVSAKKDKKVLKAERKAIKANNKESRRKRKSTVTSVYHKNISPMGRVFAIIAGILAVAYFLVTVFVFNSTTTRFVYGDYDYQKLDSESVALIKYNGSKTSLTVPTTVNGCDVTQISSKAFKNTPVENLTFKKAIALTDYALADSNITTITNPECIVSLGNGAFSNSNLNYIDLINVDYLPLDCFADCKNLQYVNAPNAGVSRLAFENSTVSSLTIGSTDVDALYELFSNSKISKASYINTLTYAAPNISVGYFAGCTNLHTLKLTNNPTIEYGALKDAAIIDYSYTDYYEVLNGSIVSLANPNTLILDNKLSSFEEATSSIDVSLVETLVIEDVSYKVYGSLLSDFKNLTTLSVKDMDSLSDSDPITNATIRTATLPCYSKGYTAFFTQNALRGVRTLTVEEGDFALYKETFDGFNNVTDLNLSSAILQSESASLSSLTSLQNVTMPNYGITLGDLGVCDNLRTVTLIEGGSSRIASGFAKGYSDLISISIPSDVTTIGSNFIEYCKSIESITVPKTVTSLSLPLIGAECDSLTSVTVPFVGKDVKSSVPYSDFNNSCYATEKLHIITGTDSLDGMSEGMENVKALLMDEPVASSASDFLSNAVSLEYLECHADGSSDVLKWFGDSIPDTLRTVVIYATGTVTASDFKSSSITDLYIISANTVVMDVRLKDTNLNNIYFGDISKVTADWSDVVKNSTCHLLFKGKSTYNLKNYANSSVNCSEETLNSLSDYNKYHA